MDVFLDPVKASAKKGGRGNGVVHFGVKGREFIDARPLRGFCTRCGEGDESPWVCGDSQRRGAVKNRGEVVVMVGGDHARGVQLSRYVGGDVNLIVEISK